MTSRFAAEDEDRYKTAVTRATNNNYVHKSPVPTRPVPITRATARWKYSAKDLWTEECFKQEFIRSVKHGRAYDKDTKKKAVNFFEEGAKKQAPERVREDFTEMCQENMTHEVYGG